MASCVVWTQVTRIEAVSSWPAFNTYSP